MTYLGYQEVVSLNKPIFANYHLKFVPQVNDESWTKEKLLQWLLENPNFKGYCYITFEQFLYLADKGYDFKRACILLDEIHVWIDSRTSASKTNRMFTYIMLQTGKADINLYYTTQDFGQVDKRLRQRTDIGMTITRKGDVHLCTILDLAQNKKSRAVVNGPDVYHMYDTTEVVRV